jgi:hypothetical protein
MQFNTKSIFCPKQNLFSYEKYAEVHMHMNDMMNEDLGCYIVGAVSMLVDAVVSSMSMADDALSMSMADDALSMAIGDAELMAIAGDEPSVPVNVVRLAMVGKGAGEFVDPDPVILTIGAN